MFSLFCLWTEKPFDLKNTHSKNIVIFPAEVFWQVFFGLNNFSSNDWLSVYLCKLQSKHTQKIAETFLSKHFNCNPILFSALCQTFHVCPRAKILNLFWFCWTWHKFEFGEKLPLLINFRNWMVFDTMISTLKLK